MSSERDTLVEESVSLEVLDIFLKTLNILFAEVPPSAELPPDLIAALHETIPLGQQSRVLDLQMDRPSQIVEGLFVVRDEPEMTGLAMPEPEPGLGSPSGPSNTSNV
ncbi:hypothetical protein EDB87DRAFT_1694740 [Lactarius vividus]|nr:hypothetical protein EDB87DRAFT_1694740 [Lactarius vividus]